MIPALVSGRRVCPAWITDSIVAASIKVKKNQGNRPFNRACRRIAA
jgi:hypothetical protein